MASSDTAVSEALLYNLLEQVPFGMIDFQKGMQLQSSSFFESVYVASSCPLYAYVSLTSMEG
jgi:hypothetical protein